jgi:hypothetical protein
MLTNLFPLFESKEIYFITDQDDIFDYLVENKYKVLKYVKNMIFPTNCINILTLSQNFLFLKDQMKDLANKKVKILQVPQVVFGTSYNNFVYTLEKLFKCDFEDMFKLKSELLKKFEILGNRIEVNTDITSKVICEFNEGVQCKYPSKIQIEDGTTRSVAEYLEVSFDYNTNTPSSFYLKGDFTFLSCVYAVLPHSKSISTQQIKQAKLLFNKIYFAKLCKLKIEESYAVSLKINNKEYIDILRQIVGEDLGLRVTEFSFGLNQKLYPSADWQYNSHINEGCSGVHIGFGDAMSGVHIDFISPQPNILNMIKAIPTAASTGYFRRKPTALSI